MTYRHVGIILPNLHIQKFRENEVKVFAELDGKIRISVQQSVNLFVKAHRRRTALKCCI